MASDRDVNAGVGDGKVEITLNDKPVVLDGSKQTGGSIKKAAIEQGGEHQGGFCLEHRARWWQDGT